MRKLLLLLALSLFMQLTHGHAQVMRTLPAAFERGRTAESQPLPHVKIGSRVLRLAPGAVIYDQHNRSIVHEHLPVGSEVAYTKDQSGTIQRIYILTDQELLRLAQAGKRQ
jgi:hypothetical protein